MRVRDLTQERIEKGLEEGIRSTKGILDDLKIDESITLAKLYDCILDDLEKMGYKITYDDILINIYKRQSIVSVTTPDKIIKLNENFPPEAQFEALFHEYVHIKNTTLPKPTIKSIINDTEKFLNIDTQIDMITYTLMMPSKQLRLNLWENQYNIDKILEIYKDIEKCTVLQWIVLNSLVTCHFGWVMLVKKNNKTTDRFVYDNCEYDLLNNPKPFNIKKILDRPHSAVAQALKKRTNVSKMTLIERKEYQCYAYYEANLKKDICNVLLKTTTVNYNRLLVIGWKKSAYNAMRRTMENAMEMFEMNS